MPWRPKRPCANPARRCSGLVEVDGVCPRCGWSRKGEEKRRSKEYEEKRPGARERGYTRRWEIAAKQYLREHPVCMVDRCFEPAEVVDHIKPHKGDETLFWDRDNWGGKCKRHHDEKTAREDGGFGRHRRAKIAGD